MRQPGSSLVLLAVMALLLSGCAGRMPVPGGSEASNRAWYKSGEDLKARLARLRPGMAEDEVFAFLGHGEEGMIRMERREVRIALLGGENAPVPESLSSYGPDLFQSLQGYKFFFKNVKRVHGFSSPIRIRTDETGYGYCVVLLFLNGALFEKPLLTGGMITDSGSRTIFDYLTPGIIVDRAVP